MNRFFLFLLFISSCRSSKNLQKDDGGNKQLLPMTIQYLDPPPSDIIQQSMGIVLRKKGFDLITIKEGLALMQTDLMNAIQEGVNDNSLRRARETKSFQILRMKVFCSELDFTDFKIDSIYWKIFLSPGNDTAMRYKIFYPLADTSLNGMESLKKFADVLYSAQ
jgi:hypothetical protein